jgi:RNA polymerase sigma-70 factor (ECF subfamily)
MIGTKEDEFRLLMERVLTGNDAAAAELLKRYGPVVIQAVRRRLNRQMRSKFDSLDFVQDVWASFFARPPEQYAFHDPEKFIVFLTRIARNKVVDATRQRLLGEKFNVNRERSLDRSTPGGPNQVPAVQPTPSEVVAGREQWDKVLRGQPLVYQRIMALYRDGKTAQEIAREMDISDRNVHRVIKKLLPRLTQ